MPSDSCTSLMPFLPPLQPLREGMGGWGCRGLEGHSESRLLYCHRIAADTLNNPFPFPFPFPWSIARLRGRVVLLARKERKSSGVSVEEGVFEFLSKKIIVLSILLSNDAGLGTPREGNLGDGHFSLPVAKISSVQQGI